MITCTAATNSAPSSRYSTASDAITAISESALLIGWRCTRRLTAPATQMAPKTENRVKWSMNQFSVVRSPFSVLRDTTWFSIPTENWEPRTENLVSRTQCDNQCRYNQVRNGQRKQKLPAKRHQLVISKPWQCAADPNIEEQKSKNLKHEPEHRQDGLQNRRPKQRAIPTP